MRDCDLNVPVWTPKRCQGTFKVCTADADCGGATGSCANAQTCADNGKSCTPATVATDCNPGVDCVKTWGWQMQSLRPYGSPIDPSKPINPDNPNDPNLRWGFPGPIFFARATTLKDPAQAPGKDNPVVTPGTRLKIKLSNRLPPQSYTEATTCNPATYQQCKNRVCSNDGTKVCTQSSDCGAGNACNAVAFCNQFLPCNGPQGPCGPPQSVQETTPNCFHGNNVTNLHLHGTHVSPQPHQDFVLLNLFPPGSQGVPSGDNYAVGDYQVDVNPFPWNQAPGTHWYHPHKHGSTSLQVMGGQAGALIIQGAFDDWLKQLYGDKLVDRIMAVQQIAGRVNYFTPGYPNFPPQLLLNGLASPVIRMRPGEIQRWRFVGGTTQAAASLEIGFDPRIKEVRQIAEDGIQFAWQNYDRQPLRDSEATYLNFKLTPGNRADFLIKAPDQPGTYSVNRRVFLPDLADHVEDQFNMDEEIAERVPPTAFAADRAPVDAVGNPLLFTIQVDKVDRVDMSFPVTEGTDPACKAKPKPARCWPDTPYYLKDLTGKRTPDRTLAFRIDGNPGGQPNSFWINESQYKHGCAEATMELGTTEDWLVKNVPGKNNTVLLAHPFHIHINPFQVFRDGDRKFDPPYIWQDSIALPVASPGGTASGLSGPSDRPAGPIWDNEDAKVKCSKACLADNATWNGQWKTTIPDKLSVCGCEVKDTSVRIVQKFEDYTGAYVIHCHFLGHEDRGMMWNVQTVCKKPDDGKFGQTQANGGADSCPSTTDKLPACTPGPGPHSH
ncbi:MAG TPA: multicopper oxidase domain-containing protein [Thermoanaerobaculia bacterium]|nr:multicopper oxidase domain-containing protein [Thermoanaerobaculia bacterium]